MATALETELAFYRREEKNYLDHYEGMFVVITGERLVGAFSGEPEAYKAGLEEVGNKPFLIKRVTTEPEQIHLPALNVGIINADLQ